METDRTVNMLPDLGKRSEFGNEWTFQDGFQTPKATQN
jgi:hypothetical protein